MTVTSAGEFLSAIGVNTHLGYMSTVYANIPQVVAALNYVGISNLRDALDNPAEIPVIQQLGAQGFRFNFVIVPSSASMAWQLNAIAGQAAYTIAVEGPNESDNWTQSYNGLTGLAATQAMQQDVYSFVKGNAALNGNGHFTPVIAPSFARSTSFAAVGDLGQYADFANIHAYFGTGNPPGSGLAQLIAQGQIVAPGLPTIATEGGYYTMSDGTGGVSPIAQAKSELNLLFDNWLLGITNTYLYELVDHRPDPAGTNREYHFGLYNNDWTPKPIADALHNLNAILADPNAPAGYQPGTLDVTIAGLPATGHSLMLGRSDGTFVLALWNDIRNWNAVTQTDIVPQDMQIAVSLPHAYQSISVFDPMISGTVPIAQFSNTAQLHLNLTDHPILVTIGPVLSGTQPLFSDITATVAEGMSAGNLWAQIIAAAQAVDPGRTLTLSSVDVVGTHGTVVFDPAHQSLTFLATGFDPASPIDRFSYVLTDNMGQTINGIANISVTGPAMPTLVNVTPNTTLLATGPGMRLISEAPGQTLISTTQGNILFFGGADTKITAQGANNTIYLAPGNHTVSVGAGGANAFIGDGNQVVTGSGIGNRITLGVGNSSVSVTGASTTVNIAGGTNTVYVTGTGNMITTGSGNDKITSTTGQATISAGDGTNTIAAYGTGNVVTAGAGNDQISGQQRAATVNAGGGDDVIKLSGTGNMITGGAGNDSIYDSGNANIFVFNQAGQGTDHIYGYLMTNGARFDLRPALAGTSWNGTAALLGNYLQVSVSNGNATISINQTGAAGGAWQPIAVLHAVGNVSLTTLLSRSLLPTVVATPLALSVAEGQASGNLWSTLSTIAASAYPGATSPFTVTAVNTAGTQGFVTLDAAHGALIYQATGFDANQPNDSFVVTLTDGLGHVVIDTVTVGVSGAALPTSIATVAGQTLRATGTGYRLISEAPGQTLIGTVQGGGRFFGYVDTTIKAYGLNNAIFAGPGNHTIATGSGMAQVQLADGNNIISAPGLGNVITAGNGNNTITGLQGGATITLGDGNQSITATGGGNIISVGVGTSTIAAGSGGNSRVTIGGGPANVTIGGMGNVVNAPTGLLNLASSGGRAVITAGDGANKINAAGVGNVVTTGAGDDTIVVLGGGNLVHSWLGNDVIRFAGSGNTIHAGGGNDYLYDSGTNNTLVLNPAGQGIDHIFGSIMTNGDVFDLRDVLPGLAWDHNPATLADFLVMGLENGNATISVNPTGQPGGTLSQIAVLHSTGPVSLDTLLAHSLT